MQVSVEELTTLGRRLTVEMPITQLRSTVQTRLAKLAKTAKIDGFRPGKVPQKMLEKIYGPQVYQEALEELVRDSLGSAISETQLQPAGTPEIRFEEKETDEVLRFYATFEVYPQIDLVGFDKVGISFPNASVSEDDIDVMIERLRKQQVEWRLVDRPAQMGDRVSMDYKSSLDGSLSVNSPPEKISIVLGESATPPDFAKYIVGLMAKQSHQFSLEFPTDPNHPELAASSSADFEVQIHSVEESKLPPMDEAFISSFELDEVSLSGLHKALRETMELELANAQKAILRNQLFERICQLYENVELPAVLVLEELDNLRKAAEKNKDIALPTPSVMQETAKRRVLFGLVVSEVMKKQCDPITNDQVLEKLKDFATSQGLSDAMSIAQHWIRNESQLVERIKMDLLEAQAIEWLMSQVKTESILTDFDTAIRAYKFGAPFTSGRQ